MCGEAWGVRTVGVRDNVLEGTGGKHSEHVGRHGRYHSRHKGGRVGEAWVVSTVGIRKSMWGGSG